MNNEFNISPRKMISNMLDKYSSDARNKVSLDIGVPPNYVNHWLDGTPPEPINRRKILEAYQAYVGSGEPKAPVELNTGALPATGELEDAELITFDSYVDKPGEYLWASGMRRFSERVFIGRVHAELLRRYGVTSGMMFYGKVGPTTREGSNFSCQLIAIDIAIELK